MYKAGKDNSNMFFMSQARRSIRPYFLDTKWKLLYDMITWSATRMISNYAAIGFYLLDGAAVLRFYR